MLDEPFSLLSSVCLMKTDKEKLNPAFLKYYIQSPMGFEKMTGQMTGAAIKRIILKTIKASIIPVPPVIDQAKFVIQFDELLSETQKLAEIYQNKLNALDELKNPSCKKPSRVNSLVIKIKAQRHEPISAAFYVHQCDCGFGSAHQ